VSLCGLVLSVEAPLLLLVSILLRFIGVKGANPSISLNCLLVCEILRLRFKVLKELSSLFDNAIYNLLQQVVFFACSFLELADNLLLEPLVSHPTILVAISIIEIEDYQVILICKVCSCACRGLLRGFSGFQNRLRWAGWSSRR